jgi:hypothetical protein
LFCYPKKSILNSHRIYVVTVVEVVVVEVVDVDDRVLEVVVVEVVVVEVVVLVEVVVVEVVVVEVVVVEEVVVEVVVVVVGYEILEYPDVILGLSESPVVELVDPIDPILWEDLPIPPVRLLPRPIPIIPPLYLNSYSCCSCCR